MTGEILFVFALLIGTIVVFILDKVRMDVVAIAVMVILALSGVVTPAQAIAGFGEPLILMIAGLFIVGEGLARTGVAASVGRQLMHLGGNSEIRLLLLMLPAVALLSAFMSSTGAVALLIPVVLSMTRNSSIQASRVLMPMAFAALVGGMLTLIGTPPNIIVADVLRNAELPSFNFFSFTPLGLAILVAGSLYLIFIARYLLPTRSLPSTQAAGDALQVLFERYELDDQLFHLTVPRHSPLVGKTVAEAGLRSRYETTVFASRHQGQALSTIDAVLINSRIREGDTLYVYGTEAHVKALCIDHHLSATTLSADERRRVHTFFGAMEVLLTPQSSIEGRTLSEVAFREQTGASVIGVRRQNQPLATDFSGTALAAGDALLLTASWDILRNLKSGRDFVILNQPIEMHDAPSHADRAFHAIAIVLTMIIVMTTGWLDNLTAILLAAFAMIVAGCLNITEAYQSLNGRSLVLIAGMLPLALAMQSSGAADLLVNGALAGVGDASPLLICGGLFLLTALLSQFISNTATTVLMAPITLGIAQGLGVNPMPFLMAVAIAASSAFATPIASPVNTLVVTPGNYRFMDFVKVGVPLQMLCLVITLLLLPLLFPF